MIHGRTLVSKQVSGIRYSTTGLISILNFYPIAFTLSSEKENLIQSDLMQYVNFKNPNVLLEFSKNSAFNPLTKELLPHDWLISVDDNNILLTALDSLHTISNKK